jgi:hypothetical protein
MNSVTAWMSGRAVIPAVPLAAPRVRVEDGVARSGQHLELVEEAHPVLRVRAAVDLEDRRILPPRLEADRRQHPRVDLRAVGRLDPVRRRLGKLQLTQELSVEVRDRAGGHAVGRELGHVDLIKLRGRSDGHRRRPAIGRDVAETVDPGPARMHGDATSAGAHRGQVLLAVPAEQHVDPLAVRAPVENGRKHDIAGIADRHTQEAVVLAAAEAAAFALHRITDPQLQVLGRVGAVGTLAAGVGDPLAVGRPVHVVLRAAGQVGDRRRLAGGDVQTKERVVPRLQPRPAVGVGPDDHLLRVRSEVEREETQRVLRVDDVVLPGPGVHEVNLVPLPVEVAVAVEAVPVMVQDAGGIAEALLLALLLGLLGPPRVLGPEAHGDQPAVGRPAEPADRALVEPGEGRGFAALGAHRKKLWLVLVAGADEGDAAAIRRPAGVRVLAAVGELTRLAPGAAGVPSRRRGPADQPEVGDVLVLLAHVLLHENHVSAVGRDLGIGDEVIAQEVLGRDAPPARGLPLRLPGTRCRHRCHRPLLDSLTQVSLPPARDGRSVEGDALRTRQDAIRVRPPVTVRTPPSRSPAPAGTMVRPWS